MPETKITSITRYKRLFTGVRSSVHNDDRRRQRPKNCYRVWNWVFPFFFRSLCVLFLRFGDERSVCTCLHSCVLDTISSSVRDVKILGLQFAKYDYNLYLRLRAILSPLSIVFRFSRRSHSVIRRYSMQITSTSRVPVILRSVCSKIKARINEVSWTLAK